MGFVNVVLWTKIPMFLIFNSQKQATSTSTGYLLMGMNDHRYSSCIEVALYLCLVLFNQYTKLGFNGFPLKYENFISWDMLISTLYFFTFLNTKQSFLNVLGSHHYLRVPRQWGRIYRFRCTKILPPLDAGAQKLSWGQVYLFSIRF